MKVSVIILNWNAEHLLRQFLTGIVQHSTLPHSMGNVEIIVADNGSTDSSEAYVASLCSVTPVNGSPSLRWLPLGENYGFAEGYNRAIAHVDADYVVLLNDDVEVTPNWLVPLVSYMDAHPDTAACQPKLLSQCQKNYFEYAGACGGYLDRYGYPYCRGRLFNTIEKDHGQYDVPASVLWATGACLFIRTDDYRIAGGLDARFFAHMEEVDLCWRLRCRQRAIVCLPQSIVYHVGGASLAAGSPRKTFLNFRNNLLMLYKNLPQKELKKVLFIRAILDIIAAFTFLLKGEKKNFIVVLRARQEYHRMRPSYVAVRQANIDAATSAGNPTLHVPERSSFSLLVRYHLLRRKTYDKL